MVEAFILVDEKLPRKINKLIEITKEDSFKLLSLISRHQDSQTIHEYLNGVYSSIILNGMRMYMVKDVRIQVKEVDYYV